MQLAKKLTTYFIFSLTCFLYQKTYGFDKNKCHVELKRIGGGGSLGGALFPLSTSSAEFTSSWGPCSMIGLTKPEQQEMYISENIESLKNDSARGSGETLDNLLALSSCAQNNKLENLKKEIHTQSQQLIMLDHNSYKNEFSSLEQKICG